jgi:hypothetical protein
MTNRVNLWTTTLNPAGSPLGQEIDGGDVAEWAYEIPLSFKLLVSANPAACPSMATGFEEKFAICGEVAGGRANLNLLLDRLESESVIPAEQLSRGRDQIEQALADITGGFFILEPLESRQKDDEDVRKSFRR